MAATARQLALLQLLARPGVHTLRSLAQRFGVSKNTVQRDLDHLSRAGAALTEEVSGQTLHFSLASAPPPTPTPSLEVTTLALAAAALTPFRGAPWCRQLLARLPATLEGALVDSTSPGPVHAGGELMVREVLTGLLEHRRVRLTYRGRGATRPRPRTVEPARLRVAQGLMYLDAWTVPGAELRTLALHRITEARVSQQGCTPRPLPARTAFGAVEETPTPVVVHFAPHVAEFIRERRWHPTQHLEPLPGGTLRWSGTVSGEHEFLGWVLSWSPAAELISPPAWRARLRERALAAAQAHAAPQSDAVSTEAPPS